MRFGAALARWGPARLQRLEYELDRADIAWPGSCLTSTYAALRAWCVRSGHGLGQKDHEADRWVAATAMWLDIPLIAHDAIFAHVRGPQLVTKLRVVSRQDWVPRVVAAAPRTGAASVPAP